MAESGISAISGVRVRVWGRSALRSARSADSPRDGMERVSRSSHKSTGVPARCSRESDDQAQCIPCIASTCDSGIQLRHPAQTIGPQSASELCSVRCETRCRSLLREEYLRAPARRPQARHGRLDAGGICPACRPALGGRLPTVRQVRQ
eukprot:444270-Prymnesium_polylepis.1